MYLLIKLFFIFAKVGILAYGGGPAMIPLVQIEVVQNTKWMTMTEFMDTLAMGYSLPGPITTKVAATVGYKISGIPGAIVALTGIVLPSAILMLFLVVFFMHLKDHPLFEAVMRGIRPVILSLLAFVVYQMFPKSIISITTGIISIICLLIMIFCNIHPAFLIILGGIIGFVLLK